MKRGILSKSEIPEEELSKYRRLNRKQRRLYARKNKEEWAKMQERARRAALNAAKSTEAGDD